MMMMLIMMLLMMMKILIMRAQNMCSQTIINKREIQKTHCLLSVVLFIYRKK